MRLQFSFAWPLLFSSGYLLATMTYGGFSWLELAKVALIGFFGFEAGLVLNDYIDRDIDKKDVEPGRLTKYWRLFGTRPLPAGSSRPCTHSHSLACLRVLPRSHPDPALPPFSLRAAHDGVLLRDRGVLPEGEADPAGIPVPPGHRQDGLCPLPGCGLYLCRELPDIKAFLYFIFFYPFALAHLGVNDLIDEVNDRARGLRTIPTIYDAERTTTGLPGSRSSTR